jgi:cob(I)alamin adenosyltransferase
MKIYTKTGDKGKTSLATGKRVSKSDLRLEAYGTADELNSYVGLVRSLVVREDGDWAVGVDGQLGWIQNRLFDLGAILAGSDMPFSAENVSRLEGWIDVMQAELPVLRAFILPGGNEAVSHIHICRCVCRRLERAMVVWQETSGESVGESVCEYVNRLSDYCFVLGRYVGQKMEINPSIWEK